jgi:hypothetical protein
LHGVALNPHSVVLVIAAVLFIVPLIGLLIPVFCLITAIVAIIVAVIFTEFMIVTHVSASCVTIKKCAHASRRQQHLKPHITNNNCIKMQQGKKTHFRCSPSLLLFSTAIGRVHRKKDSQRLLLKVLFARRTVPIIAAAILVGLARKCNIHAGMLRGSSDAGQFGSTPRKERVVVYRTCVGAHYGEENFETAMCQRQRQRERAVVAEYMCLQEPPIGQEQEVEVMLRPSAGNLTEIS